jgi:mono/diheme cytochrome c family protein
MPRPSATLVEAFAEMRENAVNFRSILATIALTSAFCGAAQAQTAVERGKYLVTIAGCSDCHTPGTFLGNPDMKRFLGGSDVGFFVPGLGVAAGRNLTPDKETGLGNWTDDQIVTAIKTGVRPDGRNLSPVMPFPAFASLSADDAKAIVAFLRSIPAVKNAVAGPFKPDEQPTGFVFAVLPAPVFNTLPKPPAK